MSDAPKTPDQRKNNRLFWLAGALFSGLYLLNPTMGLDCLPDNLPLLGNLDEATATVFFLFCLNRLGLPLPFRKPGSPDKGGRVVDI